MAFSAPPTIVSLGKNTVLLTGAFNLAAGAAGNVGVFGSGLEVELPQGFGTGDAPTLNGNAILNQCLVTVYVAPGVGTSGDVRVQMIGGGIRFTNFSGADATGNLEIRLHFLHSYTR